MRLPSSEKIYRHLTLMQSSANRELEAAPKVDKELRTLIAGKLSAYGEIANWFENQNKKLNGDIE